MRYKLEQLLFLHAVVDGAGEMAGLLLGAVHGHKGCTGDQAAVALGEAGPLPDVTEQHVVGEIDQLGRERAQRIARVWSRWLWHGLPRCGSINARPAAS